MRLTLLSLSLLLILLSLSGSSSLSSKFRQDLVRARAQEVADRLRRGFRTSALATARGFGKRSGPLVTSEGLAKSMEAMEGDSGGREGTNRGDGGSHWRRAYGGSVRFSPLDSKARIDFDPLIYTKFLVAQRNN